MRDKRRLSSGTFGAVTGIGAWTGLATVTSGTTVVSVAATACRSGSLVFLSMNTYATAQGSSSPCAFTANSIDNGRFMIFAVGSVAPVTNVGIAYQIVRRA